jgi:hypothetical protein
MTISPYMACGVVGQAPQYQIPSKSQFPNPKEKIKSLLGLIMKNSYIENEAEGYEG